MTRLGAFLCKLNSHRFDETDDCNRVWCSRCGARQPKRFGEIADAALAGRQLTRPKTKSGKIPALATLKPAVKPGDPK